MSKRKTKTDQFKVEFNYWAAILLDKAYPFVKDTRFIHTYALVDDNRIIRYNPKKLKTLSDAAIMCAVFHEIGHLIQNLPYNTEEQQIECEYQAEKYALKMLWKHYRKYYYEVVKSKRKDLKEMSENSLHYKAFSKIKVYKEPK